MGKRKISCFLMKKKKKFDLIENYANNWESTENIIINGTKQMTNSHVLFVHHLTSPLEIGSYVNVRGNVHPTCLRFAVDFVCGERSVSNANIAFHFNPRLDCEYVVRNSLIEGSWDTEETTSSTKLRLRPGEHFEFNFFVTPSEFMVLLDGHHFCSFTHRLKATTVTSIDITGDVTIESVNITRKTIYPPLKDISVQRIYYDVDFDPAKHEEIALPYYGTLEEKLFVGCQLEVYGRVKLLPHAFFLNIQLGCHLWPHPKIPLHLNPRFSAAYGANTFVRNSWSDGQWKQEECAPCFPFESGHEFLLVVRMEQDAYSVWVNNKLTGEFPYRVRLEDVKEEVIHIGGDIYLDHITVRRKIANTAFAKSFRSLTKI